MLYDLAAKSWQNGQKRVSSKVENLHGTGTGTGHLLLQSGYVLVTFII